MSKVAHDDTNKNMCTRDRKLCCIETPSRSCFLLVGDAELHWRRYLEADHLFIDGDPLPRNPHVLCLLIQLVNEHRDLPERISLLLLLWIVTIICVTMNNQAVLDE